MQRLVSAPERSVEPLGDRSSRSDADAPNLANRLVEVYANGLNSFGTERALTDSGLFDAELEARLQNLCPESDRQRLRYFSHCRRRGLDAARLRHFHSSLVEFRLANASLAALTPVTELVCRSFLAASVAYLEHARGRPQEALALLQLSDDIDSYLEAECGLDILIVHRAQVLHNRVRVEARFGDPRAAAQLGLEALAFIAGGPATDRWQSVPLAIRAGLYEQVTVEIAMVHAVAVYGGEPFRLVDDHPWRPSADLQSALTTSGQAGVQWLATLCTGTTEDLREAVRQRWSALLPGMSGNPSLWYSTFVVVLALLADLSSDMRELCLGLFRQRADWLLAPRAIRNLGESILLRRPSDVVVGLRGTV